MIPQRKKKVLEIVTMQAEVQSFWRNVKENREMTWGKGGKEGGKDNPGGGNQGGGNQGGKPNGGKGKWNKNKEKNKGKGKDDKEDKDETASAVGVQGDNSEKYCFKCGDS